MREVIINLLNTATKIHDDLLKIPVYTDTEDWFKLQLHGKMRYWQGRIDAYKDLLNTVLEE